MIGGLQLVDKDSNMTMLGSFKYDFETASWIVRLDDNPDIEGSGTTPEEAIDNLRYQANKHDLWPKAYRRG